MKRISEKKRLSGQYSEIIYAKISSRVKSKQVVEITAIERDQCMKGLSAPC